MKLFKNRKSSQEVANGNFQNSVAASSSDTTFPLLTFEPFQTSASNKQLLGSVNLSLYHNIVHSLSDIESDSTYMEDWQRASQEDNEDINLIEGILLEDAVVGIYQAFAFIKSKPVSTVDPETWTYIVDALCCACRLSCSPSFISSDAPESTVPHLIFTVARLCDGVFRLANNQVRKAVPSSCTNLPNIPPDDWTIQIYRDIVCGRGSAWIALAKVNAWQIGRRWPVQHEIYAKMRALYLAREMDKYKENSSEEDMAAALDLAILVFAKAYRDTSVKNRPSKASKNCLNRFSEIVTRPIDVIVFDLPELNGGYGDIFGVDPLEQVAFLSRHYREALLNGS